MTRSIPITLLILGRGALSKRTWLPHPPLFFCPADLLPVAADQIFMDSWFFQRIPLNLFSAAANLDWNWKFPLTINTLLSDRAQIYDPVSWRRTFSPWIWSDNLLASDLKWNLIKVRAFIRDVDWKSLCEAKLKVNSPNLTTAKRSSVPYTVLYSMNKKMEFCKIDC